MEENRFFVPRPIPFEGEGIESLSNRIGIPPSFFESLVKEDDWSFIIKLHALFEAAVNLLLVHALDNNSLDTFISRLELSNNTTGKLAMAKSLRVLGEANRRFLRKLSELRNQLIHDVRNIDFSLSAYVEGLNADRMKAFAIAFSPFEALVAKQPVDAKPEGCSECDMNWLITKARSNPKVHIWAGAYAVLVSVIDEQNRLTVER
jgi:hypothetical protein